MPKTIEINEHHEQFHTDMMEAFKKHGDNITAEEMLALAAQVVGKLVAMQDQRKYTSDAVMELVADNLKIGNQMMVEELMGRTVGTG